MPTPAATVVAGIAKYASLKSSLKKSTPIIRNSAPHSHNSSQNTPQKTPPNATSSVLRQAKWNSSSYCGRSRRCASQTWTNGSAWNTSTASASANGNDSKRGSFAVHAPWCQPKPNKASASGASTQTRRRSVVRSATR